MAKGGKIENRQSPMTQGELQSLIDELPAIVRAPVNKGSAHSPSNREKGISTLP
jgi:hypothetical protein